MKRVELITTTTIPPQTGGSTMLKPRGPCDAPQVLMKPWFWQDGVIAEMRDEIQKLEAENRRLRADRRRLSPGPGPGGAEERPEENPYLRRNASAPVLKGPNEGKPPPSPPLHRVLRGALWTPLW